MRCVDCVWWDNGECIKLGKAIRFPNRPRYCQYYNKVPEIALNYFKKISEITELGDEVKYSQPFKNLLRKFREVEI